MLVFRSNWPVKGVVFCLLFLCGMAAMAYTNLTEAYTALGFNPKAAGNSVVVFFSDPHMSVDTNNLPAPVMTTNLAPEMLKIVNEMDPPPAKIIISGDVSSSFAAIPGADATGDVLTYRMATNEMQYFKAAIKLFTNIAETNIVWIPGNHDQGAFETNAETFRLMFPNMPPYQAFEVAGVPFFLVNAGNYGQPGETQSDWLKAEVSKVPKTQPVVVVTHQPPFTGVVAHRGTARLLREAFGEWESRWWMLDGHEHHFDLGVYDVGKSNVAQITIGPSTTNTFVGFSYDCGFMVLCLSNGIQHVIYHRYLTGSYDVLPEPEWDSPRKYSAAFEGVDGLLWRRLKSRGPAPELVRREATDSIDWWAYTTLLEWQLPLGRYQNEATHFLLLAAGLNHSATVECSIDRTNWRPLLITDVRNHVYYFPFPVDVAAAETAWVRLRAPATGNNWVGGWGLCTTNGAPTITYPQIDPIPYQVAVAGSPFATKVNVVHPYAPPDKLRFSIVNGPPGATIDRNTGVFSWRPPVAEAPSTAEFRIRVEDDGTPVFAAEGDMFITTKRPASPQLEILPSAGAFVFRTVADAGSYSVWSSEDGEDWNTLTVTNPPDLHLEFIDPEPLQRHRFYRVFQEAAELLLETLPREGDQPQRLRVSSGTGNLSVQVSEDSQNWQTVLRTNIGPVRFEWEDTSNTGEVPLRYRVINTVTGVTAE